MAPPISCAVLGCLDTNGKRHYFPNPKKNLNRFKEWLIVNPTLEEMNPNTVFFSKRVCARHFLREYVSANNRLFNFAVPKLYLPGDSKKVKML